MGRFEIFEHTADIGVRGFGKTVEEAFTETAKAMYSIMIKNINEIELKETVPIDVFAEDIEELLVEYLNELLYITYSAYLVFRQFEVKIKKKGFEYVLNGVAVGEELNEEKHQIGVEVKAATFSQLKVKKEGDIWIAQCVLDV